MIGYYPCAIFALLVIYPHFTKQTYLCTNLILISQQLHEENSSSTLSKNPSNAVDPPPDIVCKKLDANQKQDLCDLAMKLMINEAHGKGSFGSFLKTESTLEVPPLAKSGVPSTGKVILIEGIGMEKNMHWCENRVYKNAKTDETCQAAGFFIAGSRKWIDTAFMFKQSPTNDKKVIPLAKIGPVPVLEEVARRFGLRSKDGSSSSSEEK